MRALARAAATALELTAVRFGVASPFQRLGLIANEPWGGGVSGVGVEKPSVVGAAETELTRAMGNQQSVASSANDMASVIERLRNYHNAQCVAGTNNPTPLATRTASVLVPLVMASSAAARARTSSDAIDRRHSVHHDSSPYVLLCTRSESLSSHAGEVCLPGGKNDEGEGDTDCALREAEEEIGLRKQSVTELCSLPPFLSKGKVSVRPLIGLVEDTFQPTLNHDEVSDTFCVPLKSFLSNKGYSFRDWEFLPGREIRVHFFEIDGNTVWGLTASVLIETAEIAFGVSCKFPKQPPGKGGTDIQNIISHGEEDEAPLPRMRSHL